MSLLLVFAVTQSALLEASGEFSARDKPSHPHCFKIVNRLRCRFQSIVRVHSWNLCAKFDLNYDTETRLSRCDYI